MLKAIFGTRPTNRIDVVTAIGGACFAVLAAVGTVQQYKQDNPTENEENNK